MAHLSLTFLGTFQVVLDGEPIHLRSNNVQGLLAYLALQPQRTIPRETIATLFWPDSPESSAKKNLRQLIYQLRQLLQDDEGQSPFLLVTRQSVQFNPDSDFTVDVLHLGQALAAGVLETAVSLYQGELLGGFTCDSLEFEAWLRQEREHLHRLALTAMSDLTERQLSNGAYTDAQATAQKQLQFEPWRETAHQQLMRAYAFAGERSAAIAQYQQCVQHLDEELGVLPVPETEDLLAQIESGALTAVDPNLLAGRYRLGDQIGQGAMGIVYRGLDMETGQMVAIKLLDPSRVAAQPELIERFLREGEALRQLNHPNIVELLATEERNGRYYLIMSYYSGGDLQQRLQKDPPLTLEEALTIALDLADALTRAHRLNILHRDIKPANVLLSEDSKPRLSDFGIARLGLHSEITQTGTVLGTTAYLSPEACKGIVVDERADIWAFGLLLYEMVTGVHPFQKPTMAATLMAILQTPLPNMQLHYPHLPPPLSDLLTQMLTKEVEKRLPSIRHAAAVLEAILHNSELPTLPVLETKTNVTVAIESVTLPPFPAPDPNFIGRVVEISRAIQTLNKPSCRIMTFCGAGGIGKSSLAIQVAYEWMQQTGQTASFVALGDVTESVTAQRLIKTVAEHGGAHNVNCLLLLDGLEALLATDGDVFVRWLDAFIADTSTTIQILVTSRQPLSIQQEWLIPVGGLSLPFAAQLQAGHWQQYDALVLFQRRAQQASGAPFNLTMQNMVDVVELCRLLEGFPLNISLAASLTRQHSVPDILHLVQDEPASLAADLRDLPPQQRSLYAVFDRSWQLLSASEQNTLAQTAVFRNGFSRAAARTVLGDAANLLPLLVEKSLLRLVPTPRGATRFRYHLSPLLQTFLLDKDVVSVKTYDRHAEFYLAWAVDKQALLADERENLLAAWSWAQARRAVTVPRDFQPKRLVELDEQPMQTVVAEQFPDTAVLVGRDEEIHKLRTALAPILYQGKNGGLITIIGDAGIGKTELVHQLRSEESAAIWFDCPCDENSAQAYHPFRTWLRAYFRQKLTQSAKENGDLFHARLNDLIQAVPDAELADELTRLQSFLAALADLILPDSLYSKAPPEQRSENFKQAIKALIQAESLLQPVVLHIEDAHWLDQDSRQLIASLFIRVASNPFAILLTARPQQFEPFVLPNVPQTTIRLHPLDAIAVHQLAAHHLRTQPSEALENLLLERGQGNPFYMTQLLFYLRENGLIAEGDLVRGRGQASFDALIPVDVHNLLVARLGQLDTAVRDVVAQAAVLGHEFSLSVMREMVGETALNNALIVGRETDIWQPRATGRYLFSHALLRDAAYSAQFNERKQEFHQKAAAAVTAVSTPDQPHYATLAHHYDEAGDAQKAVINYQKAGDGARENYFVNEAHRYYTRGLELAETDKQKTPLLLGREAVNHWLGNREEQQKDLERLVALTAGNGDKALLTDIALRRASFALATTKYEQAIQFAQKATAFAAAIPDRALEAEAYHRWGRAQWQAGQAQAAKPLLKRAYRLAQAAQDKRIQAECTYDLGMISYYNNHLDEARTQIEAAIDLFTAQADQQNLVRCIDLLGTITDLQGDYQQARDHFMRALELSRTLNWTYGEAYILAHIGDHYFALGDYEQSRQMHQKALSLARVLGEERAAVISLDTIGLTYQFENKIDLAREYFEAALAQHATINYPRGKAFVQTHLGLLLTNLEETEQASIYLYDALTLRSSNAEQLAVDTEAALAWLDMARGDTDFALERTREVTQWLADNGVAGVELPLQVYWQCFTILRLSGVQEEAFELLQTAYDLLQAQAQRIVNEADRQQYLANVPYHRQIMQTWQDLTVVPPDSEEIE